MEFAEHLRRGLLEEKPKVVAVEIPVTLETAFQRAVDRLPELSVIIYEEEKKKDRAVYLPVEVTDPFVEALRTAREIGAQTAFLDPDIAVRPHVAEIYPDPYAVHASGAGTLHRFLPGSPSHPGGRLDRPRPRVGREAPGH